MSSLAERLEAIPLDDVVASQCRRSFARFVKEAWANSPRAQALGPLVWNWHLDAVCKHLEAVARGDIRYLLINQPPRTTKTELVSIFFLPWVWTWRPGWKAIFSSLTQKLANEASVSCREVIESDWYQRLFVRDQWQLRDDKNSKDDFGNTVGGSRFSTSVGGTVIGRGAHCIVGDDLQDAEGTAGEWRRTRSYWSNTLSSRADDPATVAKICVQQRLGRGDLSEYLLASGLFTHLCLPMEYGEGPANSNISIVNGVEFWRDPRTKSGELLNPRRYDDETAARVVAEAKTHGGGVGPVKFRAQYNQNPANEDGGEFRRSYWRFYRDERYQSGYRPEGCVTTDQHPAIELPAKLTKIISMDTAVKEKDENDWTVVGAVAHARAQIFLPDLLREHRDIIGMIAMLRQVITRHPDARQKYVEDKASGSPLLQLLQKDVPGLIPVDPKGSKRERARASILPRLEAGQIFLPEGAPWLEEFVAEFEAFPFGDYDDQVDMLSQALLKIVLESSLLERARVMGTW